MNNCHDFRYGKIMYNVLDSFVGRSLMLYGEYSQGEAELFEQLVHNGDVVVEVGANIGAHTVRLSQLAGKEGSVFVFEPQRICFQLLCGNIALNSLTNVYAYQKCVSDKHEIVKVPQLDPNIYQNWGDYH